MVSFSGDAVLLDPLLMNSATLNRAMCMLQLYFYGTIKTPATFGVQTPLLASSFCAAVTAWQIIAVRKERESRPHVDSGLCSEQFNACVHIAFNLSTELQSKLVQSSDNSSLLVIKYVRVSHLAETCEPDQTRV